MAKEAYYCTVKELNELGRDAIPAQLRSNTHLIYSSPATLFLSDDGRVRYRNGASFEKNPEGSRRDL